MVQLHCIGQQLLQEQKGLSTKTALKEFLKVHTSRSNFSVTLVALLINPNNLGLFPH